MPTTKKIRPETRRETTMEREERVKIKIEFNLKRVQRLVQLPRTENVRKALAYHRDQIMRLHKIQKGFIDERKRIRNAILPEIEKHCWTMMQGNGFDDLLTSDDAPNRDPPNLGDQDQMAIDQPTNYVANAQFDALQDFMEKATWKAGGKPPDPFALTDPVSDDSTLTEHNRAFLRRIAAQPRLVDFYPHTKAYLEKTPSESNDGLRDVRRDARSAIEAYRKRREAEMRDVSCTEKQQVRARISAAHNLSTKDKLILTLVTFIPQGSYTTYAAICKWASDAGVHLIDVDIFSTLKSVRRAFGTKELPSYRVIGANGGFVRSGCDWGGHMPEVDEWMRLELLENDNIEYDKRERRLRGTPFSFYGFRDLMKGTTMENYVNKLPSRFEDNIHP
ncbi:hypothetical protein J4E93_003791 [Alternaria ventricosa]|uniref:uncharacterized protein n=1 Tax=Alternaria ventricosa TaxID=1187951 RepID=UPI0020C35413|nr:uncharacterized protein J4E93_003791 [Alternaria ventricosa]KAI4649471.1 hypothetical protein J4E93_003791 [Alternaria ventricosa]